MRMHTHNDTMTQTPVDTMGTIDRIEMATRMSGKRERERERERERAVAVCVIQTTTTVKDTGSINQVLF